MRSLPESFVEIEAASKEFFARHWKSEFGAEPQWNNPWLLTGSMPGHDSQGVYTLFGKNDELLYIGVGASFGGGIYTGHGLGARIKNYIEVSKDEGSGRSYQPKGQWKERGLSKIVTLGFSHEFAYLAYALEAFLISRISTPQNKVRSARTNA